MMNNILEKRAMSYPNFWETSLQTFNDRDKSDTKYCRIMPTTRENLKWCEEMQKTEPIWVFFSTQPMEEWKRNKESVKFIQSWIVDIDEWDKSLQLELINNAPLKPTFVNESVHGFHLFYIATEHLTIEQYIEWNQWLRDYYSWDQKVVKDTARVLRVPWFLHCKWEPTLVQFREDLSSWGIYSYDEIVKAFPKKEEEKKEIEIKPFERKWSGSDSYWERVNQLSNKQMLYELSGTRWVDWEIIWFKPNGDWTEQITINWVARSCWIDKNWMIGSYDKGWPCRPQWLTYYKKRDLTKEEWSDLAKWLNANHPELEDKKETIKLDVKVQKPKYDTIELKLPDFTWGDDELDDNIWKLSRGQLVILSWETWAGKTTFATFMARKNPKSYYFVLEDTMPNIAKRYALKRAWITKKELNNGTWSEEKKAMFDSAYKRFMEQDIRFLDIWEKIQVSALTNAMLELKEQWYWMFFIDNLWFVIWEGRTEAEQTADISAKLVSFCLKENVCIVLLHHFKKPSDWNRRRDITSLRGSGKLWDDAFLVANYRREDEWTLLEILKDRTRWDLDIYRLGYEKWDFYFIEKLSDDILPTYNTPF